MTRGRRELLWVAAGQAIILGIGFLSIKVLTNIMGAATYGQLMLGISMAALVSLFIYGPLGQAATRFYSVCRQRGDLGQYVSAFRTIHVRLFWVLLGTALAIAVVSRVVVGGVWPYLVAAAILYAAVTGINHGLLCMFAGMRRRAVVALHQGGESAARLLGAVIAMLIAGISPGTALIGYALGGLFVMGSLLRLAGSAGEFANGSAHCPPLAARGDDMAGKTIYDEIRQYVLPFLVWAAIGYAFMHGDRWMLQGVRGPEAVGIYMAIYQIGSALPNALISVMSQYLEPLVFERFEETRAGRSEKDGALLIRRAVLYIGLVLIAMVAVVSVWSMEIVDLVTTPAFAQHSGLLAWIVAGTGIIGLGQILTIPGLAMRRPSVYTGAKAVAAIALLGGAYFGATLRGAEGVAMALVVAGGVYLVAVLYVNARLLRHDAR